MLDRTVHFLTNGRQRSVLTRGFRRIVDDRAGAVAVFAAVTMTALIGAAALGAEMGLEYFLQRRMQGSADAAALSAVNALVAGNAGGLVAEGRAVAAQFGFVHGSESVTVTINRPPATGNYAGSPNAVEAIVRKPYARILSAIVLTDPVSIAARAAAVPQYNGLACVLGLDPAAAGTVHLTNNATLPSTTCDIADNSSHAQALIVDNNAITNGAVTEVGDWLVANNGHLYGSPNIRHGLATPDPYADVALQSIPSCTSQNASGNNNVVRNLTPGHFCSGFNFNNNAVVNLAPGTYYIDQQFAIKNNAVLNATGGVTLVMRGNFAIDINNNALINITAPTTGPYAGLAFFGDRTGTSTVQQVFSNNAIFNILGAVYFPNQIVNFENNGSTILGNGCTQVIGRKVNLSNNVRLESNCAGTGVKPIATASPGKLVE
jgi:hypothetical protein